MFSWYNTYFFKAGYRVFGFRDEGLASQAECMVFPEEGAIALMPDKVTYVQAAASMEGAIMPITFLTKLSLVLDIRYLLMVPQALLVLHCFSF
jgi:NADPH:quinone reductase-like Zn-dependent oxidoreductase